MENKDPENSFERKIKAVYDLFADFTFEFGNGYTIRVSKTVLAFHTDFLSDLLFGPSFAATFKVENFDSGTFKTFLDCLFGLKEYSVLDSLLIYPIAHEYQVKESLEKCVEVLKPKIMDGNVPIILNLALFYKNDEILKDAIDFIKAEIGIVGFIEIEAYRDSLEPASMRILIEKIHLNSFIWEIIYEWGQNYLVKKCKGIEICSFFHVVGILSTQGIFQFESEENLLHLFCFGLVDYKRIVKYLSDKISNPKMKLPDKSEWLKIDTESFTETIKFCHPYGFSSGESVTIKILTNPVFFENFKLNKNPVLKVECKYSFKPISVNDIQLINKKPITSHIGKNRRGYYIDANVNKHWNPNLDIDECFISDEMSPFLNSGVTNLNVSSGELVFQLDVKKLPNPFFQEFESVDVTYSFKNIFKGRFLKTTLNGCFNNTDALYFTKNLVVSSSLI